MKHIAKIFKALSDSTRLRIMLLLRERELCVCELMFILKMEQSRVSHHLRVLRDAEIAETVRAGRWIIYRVPDKTKDLLDSLFSGALRERIELSREAATDAVKLEDCIRQNVRGCVCETQPREEGR